MIANTDADQVESRVERGSQVPANVLSSRPAPHTNWDVRLRPGCIRGLPGMAMRLAAAGLRAMHAGVKSDLLPVSCSSNDTSNRPQEKAAQQG